MKTRFTKVVCTLVLVLLLNSILGCFVPRAYANQIALAKTGQVATQDAYDIWVDSDRDVAYVTCGYSGVKAFNISDPSNPTEIASVPSSLSGYAHQLVMRDNMMYLGDGLGGLKIINFGNLSSPIVLSQYTDDYAWDVELVGNTAFVANGFMGSGDRLTVVNVTEPYTPVLLGSHTTVGDATDIEIVGNFAFLTTSHAGFTVFDISNQTNPVQLGQYEGQSTSNAELGDLEIVGNTAFLSYWGKSFKVLNVSDISNIEVLTEFNESMSTFSIYIESERNFAFLCDHELGLLLLDIHVPNQLTEVTRYSDGGKPCRVKVVGNLVYMTDQDNGFVILEIGESNAATVGLELILLLGGLVTVLVLSWWLKKSKTSGHSLK
ncbi:MAG: LVIVD repeat-containing protein [Promethearchaeota archaeon]